MVKFAVLLIAATSAFCGIATASNCKHGLYYCGHGLLHKGNYYQDISSSLRAAGQPSDDAHVNDSLFFCQGDDDVPFVSYCAQGCQDGGSGKSDHC
ncbi:hypothetical protein JX265_002257 [Neoarthrinium moseri]|uniref:Uncharacterized protein n=1 Tax=Neoarthrinium moseri TaxID=1658444 RepID=A0A9P9WU30_9PEZI|nr:hypothetical protein JX265_002257 [Neoarthrinium moseri]